MLAWCAGDDDEMDLICSGGDPYKKLAAEGIYGIPIQDITKNQRAAGKIGVLACGYSGGKNAVEKMARDNGVDLSDAGTTAQAVVGAWRSKHPLIVQFWRSVEDAFREALDGRDTRLDVFEFCLSEDHNDVAVVLPTGRPIVYNSVRVKREPNPWGRGTREALTFLGSKKVREYTYGGKLTENIIQAICRELLAIALIEAERAGLNPIMTVHDEIVCDVPKSRADWAAGELTRIMTALPPWCRATKTKRAFPIGCDVWAGRRYKK